MTEDDGHPVIGAIATFVGLLAFAFVAGFYLSAAWRIFSFAWGLID